MRVLVSVAWFGARVGGVVEQQQVLVARALAVDRHRALIAFSVPPVLVSGWFRPPSVALLPR